MCMSVDHHAFHVLMAINITLTLIYNCVCCLQWSPPPPQAAAPAQKIVYAPPGSTVTVIQRK